MNRLRAELVEIRTQEPELRVHQDVRKDDRESARCTSKVFE